MTDTPVISRRKGKAPPHTKRFSTVRTNGLTTLIYPSLTPDVPDLIVQPWKTVVFKKEFWSDLPHFARDVESGKLIVEETDKVPTDPKVELNEEICRGLEPNEKQIAFMIGTENLTPQIVSAICVANLLGENGLPGRGSERVTRSYLREKHIIILKAAREFERRFQKRGDVLDLLDAQIMKIEGL